MSSPYNLDNSYFIANDFKDLEKFNTKIANLNLKEFADKEVFNIFKEVIEKGALEHFKLLENKFERIKVDLSPEEKISVKLSNNNILDKEITIDRNRKLPLKKYLLDDAVRNCKYEFVEYLEVKTNKKDVTEVSSKKVNQGASVRNNTQLNYQKFTEEVLDLEWDEIFYNADIQLLKSYEKTITLEDLNWCIGKFKPDYFIEEVINKIQNNCFIIAEQNKKEEIFKSIKLAIVSNEAKILKSIVNKINENNKSISAIDNVKFFKKEINEFLDNNAKISTEIYVALNNWKTIINKLPAEDLLFKKNKGKNSLTTKVVEKTEKDDKQDLLLKRNQIESKKKPTFVQRLNDDKETIATVLFAVIVVFFAILLLAAFVLKVDSKTFEKTISVCNQLTKEFVSAASGKIQDFKSYAKKSYNQIMNR